jgi:uncharacterized membrane protein
MDGGHKVRTGRHMRNGNEASFIDIMKRYFFTGVGALLPLVVTIYIIYAILRFANDSAGRYFNSILLDTYGFTVPGMGLIVLALIVFAAGFIMSNFLGRKLYKAFERLFLRIPLVSNIYPSVKELSDFLFKAEEKRKFKKVVLVEYPVKGSYSIGFVTREQWEEINEKTAAELMTVLVPFSPMPYSGLLLFLPEEKLIPLDISMNDAVKLVLSGGVVISDRRPRDKGRRVS